MSTLPSTQSRKNPFPQEKIDRINQKLRSNELGDIVTLIDSTSPRNDDIYHCLNYVIEIFDANNQNTDQSARSNTMTPLQKQNFVKFVMKNEFGLGEFDMKTSYYQLGGTSPEDGKIRDNVNNYSADFKATYTGTKVRNLVEAFTGKNLRGEETSCPCTRTFLSCRASYNSSPGASEGDAPSNPLSQGAPGGADQRSRILL